VSFSLNFDSFIDRFSDAKLLRNKFAELDGPFVCPPIPTWAGANMRIEQKPESESLTDNKFDRCYFSPDPGLFIGAEKEWKSAAYMKQWEHIRGIWLVRASSRNAKPCSPQEWRNMLSLPFVKKRENTDTTTSQAFANVREPLGECITASGVSLRSLTFKISEGKSVEDMRVDIPQAKAVTWEVLSSISTGNCKHSIVGSVQLWIRCNASTSLFAAFHWPLRRDS
jgi:hypothetical protein